MKCYDSIYSTEVIANVNNDFQLLPQSKNPSSDVTIQGYTPSTLKKMICKPDHV